tara:strand:+ start:594 stop:2438 length:1845 start_codon:yes stop_codon:yes gene_type:complete
MHKYLILILLISLLLILYFIYNSYTIKKNLDKLDIIHETYINPNTINYDTLINDYLKTQTNLLKCSSNCSDQLKLPKDLIIKNTSQPNVDGRIQLNDGQEITLKLPTKIKSTGLLLKITIEFIELYNDTEISKFITEPSFDNSEIKVKKKINDLYEIFVPFQKTTTNINIINDNIANSVQIMDIELYKIYDNSPFILYDSKYKLINKNKISNELPILDISKNIFVYEFYNDNKFKNDLITFDLSENPTDLSLCKINIDSSNNINWIGTDSSLNKISKLKKNTKYLIILNNENIKLYNDDSLLTNKPIAIFDFKDTIKSKSNSIKNIKLKNIKNIKNIFTILKKTETKLLNNFINSKYINSLSSNYTIKSDNKDDKKLKKTCYTNCKNTCSKLVGEISDETLDKYNKCYNNCKSVLPSCVEMCEKNKYKSEPICLSGEKCPIVYKKNKNFYIKDTKTDKEHNYGTSRKKAKSIFKLNYPNCPIPSILEPENNLDKCPFIINKNNPCYSNECKNVNWAGYDDPRNFDQKCKNQIYNYCLINSDTDEKCVCWSDEMKNNEKCNTLRRQYIDSNDLKCNVSEFKIQTHPDFYKYIKKDSIPCWNCNIPTHKPPKQTTE